MSQHLKVGQIADNYSERLWRLQKLFDRSDLTAVKKCLRDHGFLKPTAGAV